MLNADYATNTRAALSAVEGEIDLEHALRSIHANVYGEGNFERFFLALGMYAARADVADKVALAGAIVAYVYSGDPVSVEDSVLLTRIGDAELMRELAARLNVPGLAVLAAKMCSPNERVLYEFDNAYNAYNTAKSISVGPPPEAVSGRMREAAAAVLAINPLTALELCWLVHAACVVGLRARLKRQYTRPCADAGDAYRDLEGQLEMLPLSAFGDAVDGLGPDNIMDLTAAAAQSPPRRLILGLIKDAGPRWVVAVASGVQRLRGQ